MTSQTQNKGPTSMNMVKYNRGSHIFQNLQPLPHFRHQKGRMKLVPHHPCTSTSSSTISSVHVKWYTPWYV